MAFSEKQIFTNTLYFNRHWFTIANPRFQDNVTFKTQETINGVRRNVLRSSNVTFNKIARIVQKLRSYDRSQKNKKRVRLNAAKMVLHSFNKLVDSDE